VLLSRAGLRGGKAPWFLCWFRLWVCYSPEAKHSFGRIMDILYGAKTVFTRSAITLPKVNWCGWNLEHYEHIVGEWNGFVTPWPHLIQGFLGLQESAVQTASRSVYRFCRAYERDQPTHSRAQRHRQANTLLRL